MEITGIVPNSGHERINPGPDKTQLTKAAQDFEALLIAGMLKSARENESEGWMGSRSDQASEAAIGLAEEQLAQSMAAQGGLGLSKLIVQQMQVPGRRD